MGKPKDHYTNKASRTMIELIAINEAKPCTIRNCKTHRHGLNKLCGKHYRNKLYYGSPHGKKIRANMMTMERRLSTHIVQNNLNNELVQKGIDYFETWLSSVRVNIPGTLAANHMGRLVDEEVTAETLFIEVLSLFLFNMRYPDAMDNNYPEVLQIALALQVLSYTYHPEFGVKHINHLKTPPRVRKDVGKEIWFSLGKVLVEIGMVVEARDEQREPKESSKALVIHS